MSIEKDDIHAWQKDCEKKGLSRATLARSYSALKSMIKQAYDNNVIQDNPLKHVKLSEIKAQEKKQSESADKRKIRRLLTRKELQGISKGLTLFADEVRRQRRNSRKHGKPELPDLDQVVYPHWFIPFCNLALHTGLRPGDLYTLTWVELNINFKRLDKTPEKTLHVENPPRVSFKLNNVIYPMMRDWWEQNGKPLDGLVFPSRTGDQLDKKSHIKPWSKVKRLGGLDSNLNFYSFRHHFISRLVTNGVPLLDVARLAGHKSAAMIETHYHHLSPTKADEVMQTYGDSLAEGKA